MAREGWIQTTVGRQVTLQRGFDITKVHQSPGIVPVVSSAGISSYHDTPMSKGPGVVLGRKGIWIGRPHYIESDYWPHDTTLWVRDFHGNHPKFVFYFFRQMFSRLNSMDVGSANPTLNRNHVHPIEISWPPLAEQRAIARILSTLDDKIELNRRMNETLESIARALFKSWFVDFDPVRAKAEGRDSGLPKALVDLLPDSFEGSELGEIPKGWRVRSIGELARVVGGSTPSTKEPSYWNDGSHYWATPKDLASLATPVVLATERTVTNAGLRQISSGLLPPGTVLLSSRAPIGYLAVAEVPVAINQGFIAMLPASSVSNLFLLYWAEWAHEEIVSRANGSTFLEISKANFRPIPIVTPPPALFEAFDKLARPLYSRVVSNERESRSLASLRDTLLPKLISGAVSVPVAACGDATASDGQRS